MVIDQSEVLKSATVLLLIVLITAASYGLLNVQTYLYFLGFPEDRILIKVIVFTIATLETVQTALTLSDIFDTFTHGFLDAMSLNKIGTLWLSIPVLGGIVTFIVQAFYARRIFIVGNYITSSKFAAGLIISLALVQLCGSFVIALEAKREGLFSETWAPEFQLPFIVCNAAGVICDMLISCYMTFMLTRSGGGLEKTRTLIRKLVRLTLETGILTSLISVLNIIFVVIPGREPYFIATESMISRAYSTSFMVILNSRMELSWTNEQEITPYSDLNFVQPTRCSGPS